jgi:Cu/Zn superoxide dismutase
MRGTIHVRGFFVKKLALLAVPAIFALVVAGSVSARSQATAIRIAAVMNSGDERPAPTGDVANARGTFTATVTKTDAGASLNWTLTFTNMSGPATAAHIHTGARGTPGPVVVPLCAPCTSGASGTANINETVLAAIQGDRAYVNVHTRQNPAGEIRDQVSPVATTSAALSAAKERPKPKGNVRRAKGTFTATVKKEGTNAVITWRLTFGGLTGRAVAAHIHRGAPGKAGPVIVPLCAPCRNGARGQATVGAAVLNALESGRAYVNVHTRKNQAGEIRGQLRAVPLTLS